MKNNRFLQKLKEINKANLKDLFFPEYHLNKKIFRVALLILFLTGLGIAYSEDFDFSQKFYFKCPEGSGGCNNPFVVNLFEFKENSNVLSCPDGFPCNQKILPEGFEFGEPPSPAVKNYLWITLIVVILAIGINHILYNTMRVKRN